MAAFFSPKRMEEIFRNSLFPRDRKGWGKGKEDLDGVEDCNLKDGLVGGGKGKEGGRKGEEDLAR